jgi:hypothetical protein
MKFMLLVKANEQSEAGVMPDEKILEAMAKFNEELAKAGVLLDLGGLQPSSKAARVRHARGTASVIDGPFSETKELVAGYWLIQAKSKEEAIEWAKRAPFSHQDATGGEAVVEVRQLFELEDFAPSPAVDHHREIGKKLGLLSS